MIMAIDLLPVGTTFTAVISAIQHECFPEEPWSADSIAGMMATPGTFAFLAQDGGNPVGFVLARVAGGEAEILSVGVAEQARRSGVGGRLVTAAAAQAFERGAAAMFLEVAEDNAPARRLYGSMGFVTVGRRPGYYRRAHGRMAAIVLRLSARS